MWYFTVIFRDLCGLYLTLVITQTRLVQLTLQASCTLQQNLLFGINYNNICDKNRCDLHFWCNYKMKIQINPLVISWGGAVCDQQVGPSENSFGVTSRHCFRPINSGGGLVLGIGMLLSMGWRETWPLYGI